MRRIIYIATFNLFFHFYAQPLFVFIVIIIFIISTSLILSLLQLLPLDRNSGFPPRSFKPSVSTRRAQLSVAAKVVRPTDLLQNVRY